MQSEQDTQRPFSITGKTKIVGVFGYPIEHSLSPAMHNAAFSALGVPFAYVPFSVPPERVGDALKSLATLGIVGVNLTIPHKEIAFPYMDERTQEAEDVGAVNTVHVVDGKLIGDNTDGRGFWEPLREQGFLAKERSVVVLGAGGAARSVVFRLATEGAKVFLINRTQDRAQKLAQALGDRGEVVVLAAEDAPAIRKALAESTLLVQTTRVGMHPDAHSLPNIPIESLHPNLIVYDLVYNPVETRLLSEAKRMGCPVMTGVKMLVYQGAAAFQRWTGIWPPTEIMERAVIEGLQRR